MDEIFRTNDFVDRTHCGVWPEWLIQMTVASEILIAVAYIFIAATLFSFWIRRRSVTSKHFSVLTSFSLFLVFCGLGHALDAMMFYHPAYILLGLVHFATAVVSWWAAIKLPLAILHINKFRSPAEVEKMLRLLKHEVNGLEMKIQSQSWRDESMGIANDLLANVHKIRTEISELEEVKHG